jgi:Sec-independent protein translocase protein TatA
MEIFGIGPLELFFILIIALIVLGPKDMVKAGRTLGRFMRQLITSDTWRTIQQASKELRALPTRMMREAGIEDLKNQIPPAQTIRKELGLDELTKDVNQVQEDLSDWTTPIANPGEATPYYPSQETIEPPILRTPEEPLISSESDTASTGEAESLENDHSSPPEDLPDENPENK